MDSLAPSRDVAKAMAAVGSIDLSKVMRKLRLEQGWSEEEAAVAEKRYRRFLCMRYLEADFHLVPTRDIDKVWHQHILHTREYARDCDRVFGAFVHHAPGSEDSAEMKEHMRLNFVKTQAFYVDLFGEEYVEGWLSYFLL